MKRWLRISAIVLMATASVTQAATGWRNYPVTESRIGSNPPDMITEQKAIAIAQQHFTGRVLAINHVDNIYRIKILSYQGTVHIILVNASDGTVTQGY